MSRAYPSCCVSVNPIKTSVRPDTLRRVVLDLSMTIGTSILYRRNTKSSMLYHWVFIVLKILWGVSNQDLSNVSHNPKHVNTTVVGVKNHLKIFRDRKRRNENSDNGREELVLTHRVHTLGRNTRTPVCH